MPLKLLNRYQYRGTTTYFTPLPYIQVRHHRDLVVSRYGERAVCLAWLWWSLRYSWTYKIY